MTHRPEPVECGGIQSFRERERVPRRTDAYVDNPWPDDAAAHGEARNVAAARADGRFRGKSHLPGSPPGQRPDHLGRLRYDGKQAAAHFKGVQNLAAPVPRSKIRGRGYGRVRHVRTERPRHPEPHPVLRDQHVPRVPIDIRLVSAHPQHLRQRVDGIHHVQGPGPQQIARACVCRVAFRLRAPVEPQDGRPERIAGAVHEHGAVHMPGQRYAPDVIHRPALLPEFVRHRAGCSADRLPPVGRVLLHPTRPRRLHGVTGTGRSKYVAAFIQSNRFGAGRPQVNSDYQCHIDTRVPSETWSLSLSKCPRFGMSDRLSVQSPAFIGLITRPSGNAAGCLPAGPGSRRRTRLRP